MNRPIARVPVNKPSIEERLEKLERAVWALKLELARLADCRSTDGNGNVIERIRGNYTLLVEGAAILRSEQYMALCAPQVHLNPEEEINGAPGDQKDGG